MNCPFCAMDKLKSFAESSFFNGCEDVETISVMMEYSVCQHCGEEMILPDQIQRNDDRMRAARHKAVGTADVIMNTIKSSISLLAVISLTACGDYTENHYSKEWSQDRIKSWLAESHTACAHHGNALDRGSDGYSYMSEVLKCPDGTLRIIPLD